VHPRKILFCGYGRAGKDEAAMFLGRITQLRYAGSFSWAGLPYMAQVLGVHPCQAWEERHTQRQFWKDELDKLREMDQCYLARLVVQSGDIGAGLRDKKEIDAVKAEKLFDRIVWVERLGNTVDPTVTFRPSDCDETIMNDGDLSHYHQTLFSWAVNNKLPIKRTAETIALLRHSEFYAWSGERAEASGLAAFVATQIKPFSVGNE
jgi:hypothetical protein